MKRRGPSKTTEVITDKLCKHGCGNTAKFLTMTGKYYCAATSQQCPEIKAKNSRAVQAAYDTGKLSGKERYENLTQDVKDRMNWAKGKNFAEFGYGRTGNFKGALITERGHKCESCGLSDWLGLPITLELEHSDGDRKNNTRENLKLLCPNCHSQTETWRRSKAPGQNKRKHSEEEILAAVKSSTSMNQVMEKLNLRWGSVPTVLKVMIKHGITLSE